MCDGRKSSEDEEDEVMEEERVTYDELAVDGNALAERDMRPRLLHHGGRETVAHNSVSVGYDFHDPCI